MTEISSIVLALLLVIDLYLTVSSRLLSCIRLAAYSGILIGILPLTLWNYNLGYPPLMVWAIVVVTLVIKGIILPKLLRVAMDRAQVKRELEPLVGYASSLAIVLIASALTFVFWTKNVVTPGVPLLAAPVAFTTMISGLFIIVARRKALTQAVGFLFFENGITVFGLGMAVECGVIVELGIMLDVLVLVFVMGIALFRISKEFAHIDADRLNTLRDEHSNSEVQQ